MSYRIWAKKDNGAYLQLFGNNEYPEDFIEELKRQGCKVDEDGCFPDFKIKEIQPIINSINNYIIEISNKNRSRGISIYDFSHDFDNYDDESIIPLWMSIEMKIDNGYMFVVHNLLNFFKDEIYISGINCKIKDGCNITFSAG